MFTNQFFTQIFKNLVARIPALTVSGESGQVAVEYVYLALGVVLAVLLIGYGIDADGLKDMGHALSERLLMITTILKLPI